MKIIIRYFALPFSPTLKIDIQYSIPYVQNYRTNFMEKLQLEILDRFSMSYLTRDQAIYGFHRQNVRSLMKLFVVSIITYEEIYKRFNNKNECK